MIHPHTCLRSVNDQIGFGVFATALIPKGTITYAKDSLEIEVAPDRYHALDRHARAVVEKYSYIDQTGIRIVSWDLAKYVNHHCNFNTVSTGYGFEIAVRDIEAGEEITDDYGLFNLESPFDCHCGSPKCRRTIRPDDWNEHGTRWDNSARSALLHLPSTVQPLWPLLQPSIRRAVRQYLLTGSRYRPIQRLQFIRPETKLLEAS